MSALIEVHGLVHGYDGRSVLDLGAWIVADGESVAVAGPSGSGKSTLLMILAGLSLPDQGSVVVAGQDWRKLAPGTRDIARGRSVGIVFQALHLINAISVLDNLRIAQTLARAERNDARALALLEELGLKEHAGARPAALSQGERQRVAIARAVINRPALILADEPTSALDDDNAGTVLRLLREQAEACGAGLVVATHDTRILETFDGRLNLGAGP